MSNKASRLSHQANISDIINTTYAGLVRSALLPSGVTYRYVFSSPFDDEKPYLLFLHGFPETSYGWHFQIDYFRRQGYGVIAPDLLGYGGSDNPDDLMSFNFRRMASDLDQLLEHEKVDKVIGIGRDFGAPLLSRLINHHSSRLSAVAFLNNGYFPPQSQLDAPTVEFVNNFTLDMLGYQSLGYWLFFNEDNAAKLMDQHLDSFHTLAYTRDTSIWPTEFAPPGALQKWLEENKMAPDLYISSVDMDQLKQIVKAQGGFAGPLKWYKAIMRGISNPDEAERSTSPNISQPTLIIVADRDPIAISSSQLADTLSHSRNIRVRTLNAGHFMQLEVPEEVNKHLHGFIQDVMFGSGNDFSAVSYKT